MNNNLKSGLESIKIKRLFRLPNSKLLGLGLFRLPNSNLLGLGLGLSLQKLES